MSKELLNDIDSDLTSSDNPQACSHKVSEEDIKRDLEMAEGSVDYENESFEPQSMRDVRALVFQFVYAAEQFDYSVSIESIIDNFRRGFNLNISDDNAAIRISKEVIKNKEELDEKVSPLLKNWKIDRLGCCTLLILRIAMWELLYNKELSPAIVINEAIELAKSFGEKNSYKFINGILDEALNSLGLQKEQGKEPSTDEILVK